VIDCCGDEVTVEVIETYTLKQALDDGRVIWHDGHDLWLAGGFSWYGQPPAQWDPTRAVPDTLVRKFDNTYDVS
jgi:hypothetical protein